MLNFVYYFVRLGLSLGIALLNVGIVIRACGKGNNPLGRISRDLIGSSIALVLLAVVLYAWWGIAG